VRTERGLLGQKKEGRQQAQTEAVTASERQFAAYLPRIHQEEHSVQTYRQNIESGTSQLGEQDVCAKKAWCGKGSRKNKYKWIPLTAPTLQKGPGSSKKASGKSSDNRKTLL